METENRKAKILDVAQKEVGDAPEESMEDWFNRGVGDIEEGEVVHGRVVEVRDSEVLVDIGYKSEGTIAMEEFRHAGTLPSCVLGGIPCVEPEAEIDDAEHDHEEERYDEGELNGRCTSLAADALRSAARFLDASHTIPTATSRTPRLPT